MRAIAAMGRSYKHGRCGSFAVVRRFAGHMAEIECKAASNLDQI